VGENSAFQIPAKGALDMGRWRFAFTHIAAGSLALLPLSRTR
jgi:hypothetical protein